MNRIVLLGAALSLIGFAPVAQAGNYGCGCCGGGYYNYGQPAYSSVQRAAPAVAQVNNGYRSYSYEPTQAAAPAAAVVAPAPAYAAPGYSYGSSYSNSSYYGAYNRPAGSRGWNGAGWKTR